MTRKYPIEGGRERKMRKIVLGTVVFLLITIAMSPVFATASWTTGASIPSAQEGYGAATLNGANYYFGGFPAGILTQIYNITTDTWTTGAPLPVGNAELAAVADTSTNCHLAARPSKAGPCLYAVSGRNIPGPLLRYDPGLNTWTTLTPLPNPVATEHGVVFNDGKIYVIGGRHTGAPCSGLETNSLQIYDIASDTWSSGAALPMNLSDSAAAVFTLKGKDNIYVFGGCSGGIPQSTTLIYSIKTNTWSSGASLPEAGLIDPAAGTCKGEIDVAGGAFAIGVFTDNHLIYDPKANTWSPSIALPGGTTGAGTETQAVSATGRIFIVGGGIFGSGSANPVQNIWVCK